YCTYSGPHTGKREAIPAVLYMGQFFEHLGFVVVGEWYTVGEFKGIEKASLQGKLGDIRGRPNEDDLLDIDNKVREVLKEVDIANEL
ncbi:MAG: flavodoxin, partial [Deltaproteobacteria bacterium]|nr:flavodoxin [Deltaproteobacteria bacterium]